MFVFHQPMGRCALRARGMLFTIAENALHSDYSSFFLYESTITVFMPSG